MNLAFFRQNEDLIIEHSEIEGKLGDLGPPIQIPRSLQNEIEETFYDIPKLRRRFANNKVKLIRESIKKHLGFWSDICLVQKRNSLQKLK